MIILMKKIVENRILIISLRVFLSAVFIYASIDKIQNPWQFAAIIEGYDLVQGMLSHYIALFLPFLELVCGIFLLSGIFVRGSATIISAILIVFIVAISLALFRGLEINCGCFSLSESGDPLSYLRLIEDFFLLTVAIFILYCYKPVINSHFFKALN